MKNMTFSLTTIHQKNSRIESVEILAKKILGEIVAFRRMPKNHSCSSASCPQCMSNHLPKIITAVENNEPVSFVLPAFPGKSPNTKKVLGTLPDFAERLSLEFLGSLCEKVKKYYAPGIKIILCSDGRVFSDTVGIKEEDISAYQVELDRLIEELSLSDISTFNLDDFYKGDGFLEMREKLMKRYGSSSEELEARVRRGKDEKSSISDQEANHMYRGITRFLFEDSLVPNQTESRSALQRDARKRAYEVIRRSNAWTELISEYFPNAVRLSIHPQVCGSKKLGIRLIANESWMTPWHGVAVETEEGFTLLKRQEAIELGAKLIYSESGRPSHYELLEVR